jgi:hypothetical protein
MWKLVSWANVAQPEDRLQWAIVVTVKKEENDGTKSTVDIKVLHLQCHG